MKLYLESFVYMVRVTITNTIIQQNTETGRNEKKNRKAGN